MASSMSDKLPRTPRREEFATTPDPTALLAPHLHVTLSEHSSALGALNSKVDRLVTDVAGLGDKIDMLGKDEIRPLRETLIFVKGILWAFGGFSVVVCLIFGFIWWLNGSKIDALRDQIMNMSTLSEHQTNNHR